MRPQVLVVGMHRSGTSVAARLLNLMGCYIGAPEELMPAKPDNPTGFWERLDVYELNEAILETAGVNWLTARFVVEPESLPPATATELRERAAAIVEHLETHRPWVLKDPRFSLVHPVWRPLLEEPVAVLVHRNPLQVAKSLERRNQVPTPVGVALWELYTLSALSMTREMPRFAVGYGEFLTRPIETTERLHRWLTDLGATGIEMPAEEAVREFVDPGLFRARADEDDERDHLNERRSELLGALRDGSVLSEPTSRRLSADARETLLHFARTQELLRTRDHLRQALARKEAEAEAARREAATLGARIEELRSALEDARGKTSATGAEAEPPGPSDGTS